MEKVDVAYSFNFDKYFSMEKDDMVRDDVAYLYIERIEINEL
jgi:hypothetical protein